MKSFLFIITIVIVFCAAINFIISLDDNMSEKVKRILLCIISSIIFVCGILCGNEYDKLNNLTNSEPKTKIKVEINGTTEYYDDGVVISVDTIKMEE